MKIGVVKETKSDEFRVAVTPAGAHALVEDGHRVLVETGAGVGSMLEDNAYVEAGAELVEAAGTVWAESDLICKVKEPQPDELQYLRPGLVLFTYLHLAAYPAVADALCSSKTTALAYETVEVPGKGLPLLAPMSEVAGRMAPQVGAQFLEKFNGGAGILMGGVPGVEPAKVVVIGGGIAGSNAVDIAVGLGADVQVFDLDVDKLRELDHRFGRALITRMSNPFDLRAAVADADLVVGAVLVPGAKAPKVVSADDVAGMREGSVMVDIAIDQGGCFETSRETKHSDPTYVVDGVIHYAVGNIPGAVPRTSTFGLSNVTLPYLRAIASLGVDGAIERRPELDGAINTRHGDVVHPVVAAALSA